MFSKKSLFLFRRYCDKLVGWNYRLFINISPPYKSLNLLLYFSIMSTWHWVDFRCRRKLIQLHKTIDFPLPCPLNCTKDLALSRVSCCNFCSFVKFFLAIVLYTYMLYIKLYTIFITYLFLLDILHVPILTIFIITVLINFLILYLQWYEN